jgi:hypothetical protein
MKAKIILESGVDDCECCGDFDWYKITITKDNSDLVEFSGDSHLSFSDIVYADDFCLGYKKCLENFGYEVEYIIEHEFKY